MTEEETLGSRIGKAVGYSVLTGAIGAAAYGSSIWLGNRRNTSAKLNFKREAQESSGQWDRKNLQTGQPDHSRDMSKRVIENLQNTYAGTGNVKPGQSLSHHHAFPASKTSSYNFLRDVSDLVNTDIETKFYPNRADKNYKLAFHR